MMNKLIKNLEQRHLNIGYYDCVLNYDENVVTFFLYNLSEKIVGYHQYRVDGDKKMLNNPKKGKYYTHISVENEDGFKKSKYAIGVWGLETYNWRSDILFICEGIFNTCRFHNFGYPAIATFSNNPKHLLSWLSTIKRKKIAICDPDKAGKNLAKFGDFALFPEKDLDDMTEDEIKDLIDKALVI